MNFADAAGLVLLLVRPGMVVIATPFFGALSAPALVRAGVVVLIAAVLAPIVAVPSPLAASALTGTILREAAVGLAIALAIRVLVFGAELAGQLAGYSIGFSVGSLIDPQSGVRNNTLAILYANLTVVTVFATNAHHQVLQALVASYQAVPIGSGAIAPSLATQVSTMLGLAFVIGVRLAAPIVIVLLIVELALGLVAKVAPALNVMMSGAPLRLAVGLLVAAGSVATLPAVIQRYVPVVLNLAAETAAAFR